VQVQTRDFAASSTACRSCTVLSHDPLRRIQQQCQGQEEAPVPSSSSCRALSPGAGHWLPATPSLHGAVVHRPATLMHQRGVAEVPHMCRESTSVAAEAFSVNLQDNSMNSDGGLTGPSRRRARSASMGSSRRPSRETFSAAQPFLVAWQDVRSGPAAGTCSGSIAAPSAWTPPPPSLTMRGMVGEGRMAAPTEMTPWPTTPGALVVGGSATVPVPHTPQLSAPMVPMVATHAWTPCAVAAPVTPPSASLFLAGAPPQGGQLGKCSMARTPRLVAPSLSVNGSTPVKFKRAHSVSAPAM